MTAMMLKPAPFSFSRSRSSDSSASSTSSDIIPSSISDSSSTSKTNAFFASPFSTQPPSPIQPEQKSAPPPPTRSLTADFFATPVRLPSPPTTTTTTTTVELQHTIHPPRIFPPPLAPPHLPETESELISDDYGEVEEEPHTGSIISLNAEHHHHPIPRSTLSPLGLTFAHASLQDDRGTPTPTNEPSSPLKSPTSSTFSSLPASPPTWDDSESTPTLRLLRPLAHGAFSTVWLAEDLSRVPLTLVSKKSVRDLRRRVRSSSSHSSFSRQPSLKSPSRDDSASLSRDSSLKKFRDRVRETRPTYRLGRAHLDERHGEMGLKEGGVGGGVREDEVGEKGGHMGPHLSRHPSLRSNNGTNGRLVAVKMTPRKVRAAKGRRERAEEERTRVGFVREVEVLKHISHPNITPLLAHLSISTHHILVLPYLSGGDLLGLVNYDVAWGKLGESVLKRIWCELCKAVGWMHGAGLVHRDIKLENILLTTSAFSSLTPDSPPPTSSCLPTPPSPFIKLTDFGLSRFVEIDANGEAELLWTRCGSEAYAAPELVTGGSGGSGGGGRGGESGGRGVYDARKTDAWACGVVLYALVARHLPFGEGVGAQPIGGGSRIGGRSAGRGGLAERRHWLMRIARGEYEWPGDQGEGVEEIQSEVEVEKEKEKDEFVGSGLIHSQGARRIVGRLLVRDPRKRARIGDLWDDSWMTLSGGGDEVWWKERERERERYDSSLMTGTTSMDGSLLDYGLGHEDGHEAESSLDVQGRTVWIFDQAEVGVDSLRYLEEGENGEEEGEEEEEEEEDGCLFDHEGIASITRQEVV